jgi:hypothetical protein
MCVCVFLICMVAGKRILFSPPRSLSRAHLKVWYGSWHARASLKTLMWARGSNNIIAFLCRGFTSKTSVWDFHGVHAPSKSHHTKAIMHRSEIQHATIFIGFLHSKLRQKSNTANYCRARAIQCRNITGVFPCPSSPGGSSKSSTTLDSDSLRKTPRARRWTPWVCMCSRVQVRMGRICFQIPAESYY